jgi:hypothetical protein
MKICQENVVPLKTVIFMHQELTVYHLSFHSFGDVYNSSLFLKYYFIQFITSNSICNLLYTLCIIYNYCNTRIVFM